MNLSKEQLKLIGEAIDITEVKKLILDNIIEYSQFVIEETDINDKVIEFPRKDDANGCSNICTI